MVNFGERGKKEDEFTVWFREKFQRPSFRVKSSCCHRFDGFLDKKTLALIEKASVLEDINKGMKKKLTFSMRSVYK